MADNWNHTVRKITAAGVVSTLAGTPGQPGGTDGTGTAAAFFYPYGAAVDKAGNVFVTDSNNHTVRKITPSGVVTTLAGTAGVWGNADGQGPVASFNRPLGVAVDAAGNLYVADSNNHTLRKITPAGLVTTFAGMVGACGKADGVGVAASFCVPTGVAIDPSGNLYVTDSNNHTVRKITSAATVTTLVGVPENGGFTPGALPGLLSYPQSLAISNGALYITMNNAVVQVSNLP